MVNTFLADLISAVLLVRIVEQEQKKWRQEVYERMSAKRDRSHVVHSSVCLCRGMVQLTNEIPSRLTAGSIFSTPTELAWNPEYAYEYENTYLLN